MNPTDHTHPAFSADVDRVLPRHNSVRRCIRRITTALARSLVEHRTPDAEL